MTIFRNRQRSKILKDLRKEEAERKKSKMMKKVHNETHDTGADTRINGSLNRD